LKRTASKLWYGFFDIDCRHMGESNKPVSVPLHDGMQIVVDLMADSDIGLVETGAARQNGNVNTRCIHHSDVAGKISKQRMIPIVRSALCVHA
jgi:hypothetical protein